MRITSRTALPLAVMVAGMFLTGAGVALAAGPTVDTESLVQEYSQWRGNPPCVEEERGLPHCTTTPTMPPSSTCQRQERGLPPCMTTSTMPPTTTTTCTTTTTPPETTTTPVTTTTTTSETTTTTTMPIAPPSSTTPVTTTTTPATTTPVTTTVATTPPTGQGSSSELAFTGTNSNTGAMIAVGMLLVVSGVLMLVVRRKPIAEK